MTSAERAHLVERFELADYLLFNRATMLDPQDLPGREGRVVRAIDHVLAVTQIEAVLGGGWAVWRHGYEGRLTQDIDIALPADRMDEFLRVASVAGFQLLPLQPGRWPKMIHRDTGVKVDILPEGARPGTAARPAPTTIPHPARMGAVAGALKYIDLLSLIELKIAAGRLQDDADLGKLIQANPDKVDAMREHLAGVHPQYVNDFERLLKRAREQHDH